MNGQLLGWPHFISDFQGVSLGFCWAAFSGVFVCGSVSTRFRHPFLWGLKNNAPQHVPEGKRRKTLPMTFSGFVHIFQNTNKLACAMAHSSLITKSCLCLWSWLVLLYDVSSVQQCMLRGVSHTQRQLLSVSVCVPEIDPS